MTELAAVATRTCWTPRSQFPPSVAVNSRLFACDGGVFLRTNARFGEGDPVFAVGWAASEYWARRCWETPFSGDLTPPPAEWPLPPSLAFVDRPRDLSFASVRADETARLGTTTVALVTAQYRMTDGAFLSCSVNGSDGLSYFYEANNPDPDDIPVAIELKLRKRGGAPTELGTGDSA